MKLYVPAVDRRNRILASDMRHGEYEHCGGSLVLLTGDGPDDPVVVAEYAHSDREWIGAIAYLPDVPAHEWCYESYDDPTTQQLLDGCNSYQAGSLDGLYDIRNSEYWMDNDQRVRIFYGSVPIPAVATSDEEADVEQVQVEEWLIAKAIEWAANQ